MDPAWEISVHEVKKLMDEGADFLLLDVRQPEEHGIVHIEGSRLVPMGELAAALPRLQEYADRPVVVHCHHGQRSLNATAFLRESGFRDARSMAGGVDAWSVHVDPAKPRY